MTRPLSFVATLLVAVPVLAQEPSGAPDMAAMMQPAPQLQKYAKLIGQWEGAGTYTPAAGVTPIAWTAKESGSWALGNHFVELRTHVQFEGQVPPLTIRSFYGFDKERQQHTMVAANSFGQCYEKDVHWGEQGELVMTTSGVEDGKPYLSRETVVLHGDGYEFRIETSVGTSPFSAKVEGKFRRLAGDARVAETAFTDPKQPAMQTQLQGELGKLARMCGRWRLTGSMKMGADAPEMAIAGIETIDPVFGGQVLCNHVVGDPAPEMGGFRYESWGYTGWDAGRGCFRQVYVSNMGEIMTMSARLAGSDQLVSTWEGVHMGQPCAVRGVITFTGDAKSPMQVSCHRLQGGAAPLCDFQAAYAPAKS